MTITVAPFIRRNRITLTHHLRLRVMFSPLQRGEGDGKGSIHLRNLDISE
jgi:hypothetical protein